MITRSSISAPPGHRRCSAARFRRQFLPPSKRQGLARQGFRVLARASDDIELTSGGLGTAIASLQNKRDVMRATVQAALEGLRIAATQRDKVIPIYMKQFALTAEESAWVYDNVARSWALDGKPTAAANKLDFELTQRDMGLKEPPKMEQIYDFSLLDELAKR